MLAYRRIADNGIDAIIKIAPKKSLRQVLDPRFNSESVREKIVLIGVTEPGIDDFLTPFSRKHRKQFRGFICTRTQSVKFSIQWRKTYLDRFLESPTGGFLGARLVPGGGIINVAFSSGKNGTFDSGNRCDFPYWYRLASL